MPADRRFILGLFAVALGVRVLYGVLADTYLGAGTAHVTSSLIYAQKITSGFDWIGTPYSALSPGYPVVLALLHILAAKQIWITFFLQAALSALTVLLLYYAARPLVGRGLALTAGLWLSFYPLHLHVTNVFHRDFLVVFLVLLLVLILARPLKRMRLAAVAGGVYAVLVHVDPQFILMAPILAFLIFFKTRHRILNLQYLFLFAGVAVAVCVPWTIRNFVVYEQPVPVGLEAERYLKPLKIFLTDTDASVASVQARMSSASKTRRIQKNTVEFWRVVRLRDSVPPDETVREGRGRVEPAWSLRHNLAGIFAFGLLLPFFVGAAVAGLRRRERTIWMIVLVIAAYFLMRAWLGGGERARLPIDPLIILLAFYGVRLLLDRGAGNPAESVKTGRQEG